MSANGRTTVTTLLWFERQKKRGKDERFVAFYGAGLNGGTGLATFCHEDSRIQIDEEGWWLVTIELRPGSRYAFAMVAEVEDHNEVITALQESLT